VRTALRAQLVLVGGESLLLAVSAGLLTMAAAAAEGTSATEGQAIVAAGLVAILTAFTWGAERRADARTVARTLDRRSGLSGAVLTAFEAESGGAASPVADLLARKVAPTISVKSFVRDTARSSALLLAAPLASVALWMLAADALEVSSKRLLENSDSAVFVFGTAPWERLRSEAMHLASTPGLPAALAEKLRALADEAGRARSSVGGRAASDANRASEEPDLARRLEVLRRSAQTSGVTSGTEQGTMAGPDARVEISPDASMKDTNPRSADRTRDAGATPTVGSPQADPEGGVVASRWWPARYDAVVARWIESARATRNGRSR
jgi:hypothetical protein